MRTRVRHDGTRWGSGGAVPEAAAERVLVWWILLDLVAATEGEASAKRLAAFMADADREMERLVAAGASADACIRHVREAYRGRGPRDPLRKLLLRVMHVEAAYWRWIAGLIREDRALGKAVAKAVRRACWLASGRRPLLSCGMRH